MEVKKDLLGGADVFALEGSWSEDQVVRLPARTLAYVGDSVYELRLRLLHIRHGIDDAGRLHDSIVQIVNSSAQAEVFLRLFETLSEDEQQLVKTWRNAKSSGRYGSGTRGEYARATALEAWVGYLFLTGKRERLEQLFELVDVKGSGDEK